MIVTNPCINDTRVIKEAEILATHGYEVTVFCKHEDGLPFKDTINNVSYLRLDMNSTRKLGKYLIGDGSSSGILGPALSKYLYSISKKIGGILDRTGKSANTSTTDISKGRTRVLSGIYGKFKRYSFVILLLGFKAIAFLMYGRFDFSDVKEAVIRLKPEIIHVHDLTPLDAAVELGKLTGALVIYDAHELERHRNGHGVFKRMYTAIKESRRIHDVSRVITVSESIADYLMNLYGIQRPLVVLNVPDSVNRKQTPGDIRTVTGVAPDVQLAVYVGKITFGRGLEEVVKSLPYCPEVHFALLGPQVISTVENIRHLAAEYHVLERVHILDPVAPDEVLPFLRTADTGVVPIQDVCLSYRYCMPNKLFELAIAGIPVAVSNLPDMRAFIEREGVGVIMDQTSPQDIARAIRETRSRRHELILTGQKLQEFKEKYSWQGQAEKLVNLYRELSENRAEYSNSAHTMV